MPDSTVRVLFGVKRHRIGHVSLVLAIVMSMIMSVIVMMKDMSATAMMKARKAR
jgi:hypothetical protein